MGMNRAYRVHTDTDGLIGIYRGTPSMATLMGYALNYRDAARIIDYLRETPRPNPARRAR